jgi:uncharacterized protein YndB with AHSA1/START domain
MEKSAIGSVVDSAVDRSLVAECSIEIDAPRGKVWKALTDPAKIEKYMFGSKVTSDWKKGSPITWKGEWNGKKFEDKGEILQIAPERTLQYSHWSPLAGKPDRPESYHTVTVELSGSGDRTKVWLTQDGNETEASRDESAKNWRTMLQSLKKVVEGK